MARTSPAQTVFEGEFSPLAEGRTDIERYGRAMRYMSNMVPCRTGPAIGRSGTAFEQRCAEPDFPSKLLPFEFNEDETLVFEFSHFKLRFFYEYRGIAAHREVNVTQTVSGNPFTFDAPGHDFLVGESVTWRSFTNDFSVNGMIGKVVALDPGGGHPERIEVDWPATRTGTVLVGSEKVAAVYEIATPYHRDDVKNLRIVQELNVCYLFCTKSDGSTDYPMYRLHRKDTFDWTLKPMELRDGPFMPINTTKTYLRPTNKGTWVPDMTDNNSPSGTCSASSSVTNHEPYKAFDGDIDSYWEGNASQEGWLEYSFENGFLNSIPKMTAPTTSGYTISTSSEQGGFQGWKAGDRDNGTDWRSSATLPQQWQVDTGSAHTVFEYHIRASKNHEEYAPRDWTLEGSATGSGGWSVLDTRVGFDWDSGQKRQFTVQSPTSFQHYRINVTKVNRKRTTVITKAIGKKGKKNYVPRTTTTTRSSNFAGFAHVAFSYASGVPKIVDGYAIYLGRYNKGKEIKQHAPKTWYFEGWDGDAWDLLDSQQGYDDWSNYRSQFFPLQNDEPYKKYRIRIKSVQKEGDINPRIGKLVMSSPDAPSITLRATSKKGINENRGFLSTDVGRQIRMMDADGIWRWAYISAVTDETRITLNVVSDDPLVLNKQVKFWRLGLWSDTTGWPTCGTLHEDRLFVSGALGFPDHVIGSRTGKHEVFTQESRDGIVTDTHAIVTRANTKHMSRVVWLKSAEEALRFGTGKAEFILTSPVDEPLTARNQKIRQTTKRGSAIHEPVTVDNDVVFVQKGGRDLYAHTFAQGQSGIAAAYKAPLMSKLGRHLMQPEVVQIVYQQEPHSIVWGRRTDGSIVAMTYSNDDDVFGGHRHSFLGEAPSGGVYDLCTVASPTDRADSLWMVVVRGIIGENVYTIERLTRFWDFGDILNEDATFVDGSIRYYFADTIDEVFGLKHLTGLKVSVLADNIVYRDKVVDLVGRVTLERPATDIVVGVPIATEAEIIMPEAGAEDGTAQAKAKRPHTVALRLWDSANGEVGRWNEDQGVVEYVPIEYNFPHDTSIPEVTLRTCVTKATVLPGGYGTLGTVRFRQLDPLPFNVAGVYPQSVVEDER